MSNFKERFLSFYDAYKHLLILIYMPVYLIWFAYIEHSITTHFHVISLPVDDMIPFCEYFIVPYLLWFLYVAWGILYFGFTNKKEFFQLCAFLFTGMTIFLIVSTVYPNGHYLRPQYFTHHNFFTSLVNIVYSSDTPTNLFPSIHVFNSIGIHLAVRNSKEFKTRKTARLVSFTLMVSIILSTMFLKQHSVFDVITAFLLSAVLYPVVYHRNWNKASEKATKRIHHRFSRLP